MMRLMPVSGNHSDKASAARNERSGLHRSDPGKTVEIEVLRAPGVFAGFDIRHNHPLALVQGGATSAARIYAHPFPKSRRRRVKSLTGEQAELVFFRI